MKKQPAPRRIRRRTAAQAVAGAMLALPVEAQPHGLVQVAKAPPRAGLRFFTAAQNNLLDRLTGMVIPADEHSPGAGEAKVSLFIDLMVSHSDPSVQREWTEGLAAVEREAVARFSKGFLACAADQQDRILASMAAQERRPESLLARFFVRLKNSTIDGYYTSAIGIHKDLRYQGNRVMASFSGCTHSGHG